jgi:hypothetical protein
MVRSVPQGHTPVAGTHEVYRKQLLRDPCDVDTLLSPLVMFSLIMNALLQYFSAETKVLDQRCYEETVVCQLCGGLPLPCPPAPAPAPRHSSHPSPDDRRSYWSEPVSQFARERASFITLKIISRDEVASPTYILVPVTLFVRWCFEANLLSARALTPYWIHVHYAFCFPADLTFSTVLLDDFILHSFPLFS